MEATHFSMANSTTTQKLCNWFIQQTNAKGLILTPVKLNHLVILADWWHLHRTGAFLINERVEAWPSGPVLPSIYHEYKDQPPYSSIEHPSRRQPLWRRIRTLSPFWSISGTSMANIRPSSSDASTPPRPPHGSSPRAGMNRRTASKSRRSTYRRTLKAWPDNSGKNSLPLTCTAFFQSKHIFK